MRNRQSGNVSLRKILSKSLENRALQIDRKVTLGPLKIFCPDFTLLPPGLSKDKAITSHLYLSSESPFQGLRPLKTFCPDFTFLPPQIQSG
ncbi:hypothetical protein TREES_T100001792 [Tupaia chinensis]|uniref:Uncharacterized protein n=1 Tax=Tupaia chinensis TaxID=246437 RepID=L9KJ05_TUPCH|nr:hypothetical protein TREES_T100001792 [Tupaia chinensis]